MKLGFLDKKGTKQFKNVLKYLYDPNSITNPSQKTKISKEEFRKETIANSFKYLTAQDKQLLIVTIKDVTNIVDEIINTFEHFKTLDEKESIAIFLQDLMEEVDDNNTKLKTFKIIYLNHPTNALTIINETKSAELIKELCEYVASSNPERAYIYALLNDVNINTKNPLDTEKLIDEINYIQSFSNDMILAMIAKDYDDLGNLINQINNSIENRDFQMFYTLAKNIDLLSSYSINVDKSELSLLKWVIDITDRDGENDFIQEVMKKDLEPYSTQWLVFLSMNLLQMDIQKQKLAIMLLNYLLSREDFIENYSDIIAEDISLSIIKHKEDRYELLEILEELKTTNGFYNIMDLIHEEGLALAKNKNFQTYITSKIKYTKEYEWIDSLINFQDYSKAQISLNPKAAIFALREKTPKENYQLLKMLKEHKDPLYPKVMMEIEGLIANKLDRYDTYMILAVVLNYQCEDKDVLQTVKQYEEENLGIIKAFMKNCDPDFMEEYHIKDIKNAIDKKDSQSIIEILQGIEELHIKNKCSWLVLESLIYSDFYELINIWEYLTLDIESKIKLKRMVSKMLTDEEIQLREESIGFINEIGLEPTKLYNSIKDQSNKKYLLDIWYQSNEIGKIANVIKEEITNESKSLEDLKDIWDLLGNYNINDTSIDVLIKIKAYTSISLELLELDIGSEGAVDRLNELADQLNFYGLIDRFLMDKFLQQEMDKRMVDYLFRRFMDNANSPKLWGYYWDDILEDLTDGGYSLDNGKMEIFLNHLTRSMKGIEWFLDTIENTNMDNGIYMSILETMMVLLNKQNRIILQTNQEIDQMEEKFLNIVGKSIGKALSNMEKTIINRSNDIDGDVLVENLKKFRRELKGVGIDSVEDIESYGKIVEFDGDIHENTQLIDLNEGIVDSLGVRINDKNILLSTLLNID